MPSGRAHYRLALADALEAHEEALKRGGLDGVPNPGLVESAIARPYDGYHLTLPCKIAALLHGVANNHGFVDGNKRTAILLAHILIRRSGYRLVANDIEALNREIEDLVLGAVVGEINESDIEAWFSPRLRRVRRS